MVIGSHKESHVNSWASIKSLALWPGIGLQSQRGTTSDPRSQGGHHWWAPKNERDLLSKFKELLFIEALGAKTGAESPSEAASEIGIFLAQLLVSEKKNTSVQQTSWGALFDASLPDREPDNISVWFCEDGKVTSGDFNRTLNIKRDSPPDVRSCGLVALLLPRISENPATFH